MILVDTNIIMYAAGAPHSCKAPSVGFLERVAAGAVEATIDAESLQEILHRYRAIQRWEDGRAVYDLARTIFPEVIPVTSAVLDSAREILDRTPGIPARDAVHAAVAIAEGMDGVCSYDRHFDAIAGIVRVTPDA